MFKAFFEVPTKREKDFTWSESTIAVEVVKGVPTATGAIKCGSLLLHQQNGLYELTDGATYTVVLGTFQLMTLPTFKNRTTIFHSLASF